MIKRQKMNLGQLEINKPAKIIDVGIENDSISTKLREIGFAEGDEVEIIAYGPIGKTPICVRLNRTIIALRPQEAKLINVGIIA